MRRLASILLALGLFAARRAQAAGLNVSPTQVWLSPDASKALLTLRNEGQSEMRLQLVMNTWDEDARTGMKLGPTDAIVFFPAVLVLKPGETSSIRVGAAVPFGPLEQTFRLFVDELPPPATQQSRSEVRVLTRVGIPIFVAPQKALVDRQLSAVSVAERKASLDVQNTGNVHFRVESVKLEAKAQDGANVFERSVTGWYVLAGGHKRYSVEIPKEECARVRRIVMSVKTDRDEIFQQALDMPSGACGS